MGKAEQTRAAILDQALHIAGHDGMHALTLGALADRMKMSKSGVFSHFGALTNLHLAVLGHYRSRFEQEVVLPARRAPDGMARLHALFHYAVQHMATDKFGGCFYMSCAAEFDDRPGPVRDELKRCVLAWRAELEACADRAIALGQCAPACDSAQLAFDIHALLLALQHDSRLLDGACSGARARRSFDALIERHLFAASAPRGRAGAPAQEPPRSSLERFASL